MTLTDDKGIAGKPAQSEPANPLARPEATHIIPPVDQAARRITRRGDRVADCAGLENRCTARYRGFKSLPLRLDSSGINDTQKDAISCGSNGLRLVVSDESEAGEVATGVDRSQSEC